MAERRGVSEDDAACGGCARRGGRGGRAGCHQKRLGQRFSDVRRKVGEVRNEDARGLGVVGWFETRGLQQTNDAVGAGVPRAGGTTHGEPGGGEPGLGCS